MEKENVFLNELHCDFFNPNWENDQNEPFESALSSMVSSPTASSNNGNGENNNSVYLTELIGKLDTICSNSPHNPYNSMSTNNSCYNTPLSSPPKLNLSIMENYHQIPGTHFTPFLTDPGFADRAAKYSPFGNNGNLVGLNAQLGLGKMGSEKLHSSQSVKIPGSQENADSRENSSLTEQIPGGEIGLKSRKRKSMPKGKDKEAPASTPAKDINAESENNAKKSKSEDGSENEDDAEKSNEINKKQSKNNGKTEEAPKDYIHVRARRGQATDAHSLAERVRREKISERMKFLQDLVPGCNKVTGKAVMLDEIINYVQSLQHQVEFLSMKLSTIDPRTELSMESLASKDKFQPQGHLPHHMYSSDGYPFQSRLNMHAPMAINGIEGSFPANHFNAANFSQPRTQASAFWEDDLHSFVQMGYNQNESPNFHGILPPTTQMKVEQ